jgi:threonine dehydratase
VGHEITRAAIKAAAERIAPYARETPVLHLPAGSFGLSNPLVLKLEHHQRSGSFKSRGAYNLLLAREIPPAGVVAASGGNFGLAIAEAARTLGIPATVFVPEAITPEKLEHFEGYGCALKVVPGFYADALAASQHFVESSGALLAHAYDLPEIVAGAGTIARELERQAPASDSVIVAVGGGGLIGGIASWFRGDIDVVGVETEGTPTLRRALDAGTPVDVEISGIAADALGAKRIGKIGFEAASRWATGSCLVNDEALMDARRALWDEVRVLCEPAAAAPLAGLMAGAYHPPAGQTVCLVICGANGSVEL